MIVEIGTSDFRTEAGKVEGIFIEPVKEYFDRLPDCNKLNIAISNYTGEVDVYYIEPSDIEKHNMPNWVRGCNSINKPHPTVVKYGYLPYVKTHRVKVRKIKDVLKDFEVSEIDFLKIDTEGHDAVILNDFLDTVDFLPKHIKFESNELSSKKEIDKLLKRLEKNYKVTKVKNDYVCQRLQ
jgi:FkbM family methyltransferase